MRVTNGKGYQTSGRNLQRIKSFFHVCWATNQSTKGSKLIRQHLDEVKAEMKFIDDHIEELIVEKEDKTVTEVYAGEVSVRGLYGYAE